MKQNLEAGSPLCQKHGPEMTCHVLQRMGHEVRVVSRWFSDELYKRSSFLLKLIFSSQWLEVKAEKFK